MNSINQSFLKSAQTLHLPPFREVFDVLLRVEEEDHSIRRVINESYGIYVRRKLVLTDRRAVQFWDPYSELLYDAYPD